MGCETYDFDQMYDLIVLGGGPAGLAAALAAREKGLEKVLIVERDTVLGGILNQCIHNGFGLHYFKEELTGPEYAERFIEDLDGTGIDVLLDTMVLDLEVTDTCRYLHVMGVERGYQALRAKSVVLAMGCRERTRGAIQIPGSRPAGVFTAGTAQRYVNIEGWMVGKRVIILGSGDIGLIMARRMVLEGAEVLACVEIMPYSGGLNRNIVQCLNDYDIPLLLSHTITNIEGHERVEGVTVQEVDESLKPIPGTETHYDCDTVLLSVGLIPENEITREADIEIDPRTSGPVVNQHMETSSPGVFACGNVLHVHDLVDYVTEESQAAGEAAADYVLGNRKADVYRTFELKTDNMVGYTVPQKIDLTEDDKLIRVFFRVRQIYNDPAYVTVNDGTQDIARFKKPFMFPGEMQHIRLPKVLLDKAEGNTLTISVEEV